MKPFRIVLALSATALIAARAISSPFPFADMVFRQKQACRREARKRNQKSQFAHTALSRRRSAQAGEYSISGTVYEHSGTTKAAGFYLTVLDTFGFPVYNLGWQEQGDFVLDKLYSGNYLVAASRDYDAEQTFYGGVSDPRSGTWVKTGTPAAAEITITLPEDNSSNAEESFTTIEVSGICYSGDGTDSPLEGGRIQMRYISADRKSWYIPGTSSISQDGAFLVHLKQPPGDYFIAVAAQDMEGNQFAPQWLDGTPINADPVAVDLSADISGKRIHLRMGGVITGVIRTADSLRQHVSIAALNAAGVIYADDNLWSDSVFTLKGLPADDYYVKIMHGEKYKKTFYDGVLDMADATPIAVDFGETVDGIVMTLQSSHDLSQAGMVSGIVRDASGEPTDNASVHAIIFDNDGSVDHQSDFVDTNGGYELVVPANTPFILQAGSGLFQFYDYYASSEYFENAQTAAQADTLRLSEGQKMTIDFVVGMGGSIGGFVLDTQGNPIIGDNDAINRIETATIIWPMAAKDGEINSESFAPISELGGFRLNGLAEGSYSVFFPTFVFENTLPETGVHLPPVNDILVKPLETTVIEPVVARPCAGTITGAACTNGPPAWSYVLCFDAQHTLASIAMGGMNANTAANNYPVQGELFNMDYEIAFGQNVQIEAGNEDAFTYVVAYLPAGKYALALMNETSARQATLQWYGGGTSAFDEYNLFSMDIPEQAQWVTVHENQTVTGIDFCNAPARGRIRRSTAGAALSVRSGFSEGIALSYSLPAADRSACIDIYALNGAKVASLPAARQNGQVIWNTRRNGVAKGTYLLRLHSGAAAATLRVAVW